MLDALPVICYPYVHRITLYLQSQEKKTMVLKMTSLFLQVDIRRQFGLQKATRTNNYHWTSDEVNQLVEGVATLGVGRWTELKSTFFPTSIRTAQHLKV
jgi:CRISPR/Cas system Type II protein with McrA/HNH and RuvC-like nuclease domain